MEEIFKPIEGYGDLINSRYEISNFGRVRSNFNGYPGVRTIDPDGFLKLHKNKQGYIKCALLTGEETPRIKTIHVGRLVAQHFIQNPDNLPSVNHIDENKENNHFTNLEWVTPEVNSQKYYKYKWIWHTPEEDHVFESRRRFFEYYKSLNSSMSLNRAKKFEKDERGCYLEIIGSKCIA